MKKLFTSLLLFVSLASVASAHHMVQYEDAGIYIPEFSPHLDIVFY